MLVYEVFGWLGYGMDVWGGALGVCSALAGWSVVLEGMGWVQWWWGLVCYEVAWIVVVWIAAFCWGHVLLVGWVLVVWAHAVCFQVGVHVVSWLVGVLVSMGCMCVLLYAVWGVVKWCSGPRYKLSIHSHGITLGCIRGCAQHHGPPHNSHPNPTTHPMDSILLCLYVHIVCCSTCR